MQQGHGFGTHDGGGFMPGVQALRHGRHRNVLSAGQVITATNRRQQFGGNGFQRIDVGRYSVLATMWSWPGNKPVASAVPFTSVDEG